MGKKKEPVEYWTQFRFEKIGVEILLGLEM